MNEIDKELVLHKVVAASAFLFALCILPVAQYFLVTSKLPANQELGQVAGVSTDATITRSNVPAENLAVADPNCEGLKEKDLVDLERFSSGKKQALLRTYNQAVEPYKLAIPVLTGTPEKIAEETEALNRLIDAEYQPYLKKLSEVESAVESQKKLIESRSCLAE